MKIYRTKTQEDYDALMVELEKQGFRWASGKKPTEEFNYKKYTSETTITAYIDDVIKFSCLKYEMEFNPGELIVKYKAKEKVEINDFIKELTIKIYYNEVTKKHYNSYEEAIADCKKEMEKLHDKN